MDKDGSAVAISDAVQDKLPELRKDLGTGAEAHRRQRPGPGRLQVDLRLTTEGAARPALRGHRDPGLPGSLRSTLVTAVSIPLSVVLALIVLWTRDLSLNMLTLGALTIAIGRVVDDSIVVLENIKRHLGYGEERQTAIITAVREVAGAVTSSTLTTVAVFLPIGLVGGMVGELFGSFSLTVTAALLASLLVSLTVVPVLSYWFLRAPKGARGARPGGGAPRRPRRRRPRSRLQRLYVPVLRFATRRRVTSVVIAVVVLIGTFGMAPLLKTNFFDQGDQDVLSVKQELTPGTSLDAADAAAKKVEKVAGGHRRRQGLPGHRRLLRLHRGLRRRYGRQPGLLPGDPEGRRGRPARRPRTASRTELAKLDGIGETKIAAGGGFGSQDLSVVVKAADADVLEEGRRSRSATTVADARRRHRRPERPGAERAADLGHGQRQGGGGRIQPTDARRGGRPGRPRHHRGQGDPGRHRARHRRHVRPARPPPIAELKALPLRPGRSSARSPT